MTLKIASERAVHITGKLRKERDTAVFVSANGLIRTPGFCKSGGNVAVTRASAFQFSVVSFFKRIEPPRNDALGGPNPFEWKDVSTADLFAGKNVVLFGAPGAFAPACS